MTLAQGLSKRKKLFFFLKKTISLGRGLFQMDDWCELCYSKVYDTIPTENKPKPVEDKK